MRNVRLNFLMCHLGQIWLCCYFISTPAWAQSEDILECSHVIDQAVTSETKRMKAQKGDERSLLFHRIQTHDGILNLHLELLSEESSVQKSFEHHISDCDVMPEVIHHWVKRQLMELHHTREIQKKKNKKATQKTPARACVSEGYFCPNGVLVEVDAKTCQAECVGVTARTKVGLGGDLRPNESNIGGHLSISRLWYLNHSTRTFRMMNPYLGPQFQLHYAPSQPILDAEIERFRAFAGVSLGVLMGTRNRFMYGFETTSKIGYARNRGLSLEVPKTDIFSTFETELLLQGIFQNQFGIELGVVTSWIQEVIVVNNMQSKVDKLRPFVRFVLGF